MIYDFVRITVGICLICAALSLMMYLDTSHNTNVDSAAVVEDLEERVGYEVDPSLMASSPRSSKWPKVRDEYFRQHPYCMFKGCTCKGPFNVHHIKPFHLYPELELDPTNFVSVCAGGIGPDGKESPNHHLYVAHQGNFQDTNENVVADLRNGVYPAKGWDMKLLHDKKKSRLPAKTIQAP